MLMKIESRRQSGMPHFPRRRNVDILMNSRWVISGGFHYFRILSPKNNIILQRLVSNVPPNAAILLISFVWLSESWFHNHKKDSVKFSNIYKVIMINNRMYFSNIGEAYIEVHRF